MPITNNEKIQMARHGGMAKQIFWILLNATLAVMVLFGLKVAFGLPIVSPERSVTVSAVGETVVAPDIAYVGFSVVTEGEDPEIMQAANTEKMNAAIAFVKERGIADADIKTTGYNLYPRYDYRPRPVSFEDVDEPQIAGYTLTQTVRVTVRDLELVPTIVGGLPSAGVNQITEVSFEVDDPDQFLNVAREEAFNKAREKASVMARINGARLGKVVTFSEGFGGPMPYYLESKAYGMGGAADAAMPPQIEPGTQDVTVNVTVTYELR